MQLSSDWRTNAFTSAAIFSTNENNFLSNTDDAYSLDLLEAGVTVTGDIFASTRLAAQLLSRKVGDVDNGSVRFDFVYIQQRLFENDSANVSLRLGRVKRPLGLDSDTREVAFTRSSIISPQGLFYDFARNTVLSQDGGLLAMDWNTAAHHFTAEFSEAFPRTDSQDLGLILGFTNPAIAAQKTSGSASSALSPTVRLSWEWLDQNMRLVVGEANLYYHYDFDQGSIFHSGDISVYGKTLGLEKSFSSWVFSTEYIDTYLKYKDMPPFPEELPSFSYYYQALYHFSSTVYGVVRRENTYELKDDRNGKKIAATLEHTPFATPAFRYYSNDIMFGLSWQTTKNLLLRAELHFFNGAAMAQDKAEQETEQNWRLYGLQASLRF